MAVNDATSFFVPIMIREGAFSFLYFCFLIDTYEKRNDNALSIVLRTLYLTGCLASTAVPVCMYTYPMYKQWCITVFIPRCIILVTVPTTQWEVATGHYMYVPAG